MQRTTTQPNQKTLNELGRSYHDAKQANKLKFKAALLEVQEQDGSNYWRSFRDVWQYSDRLGLVPFAIIAAAHNELGFKLQPKPDQAK